LAAPPYRVEPWRQLKTLVYVCDSQPVVAVVRGDHSLNEAKLQLVTGAGEVRPAADREIFELMGAHAGSLGAVRFAGARVLVDSAVIGRSNMVTGANVDGFHLRGVDVARDLAGEVVDLRAAQAGDPCERCEGVLELDKALEVGHIFKLGTRYSEALGATVLTPEGEQTPLVMGSYGIGVGRIMAAAVELFNDDDGIIWPPAIAPFLATVLTLGAELGLAEMADRAVASLAAAGLDVLYDDRDVRAGVKFKDADLIGIPLRVGVGQRGLKAGRVEVKRRGEPEAQLVSLADLGSLAAALREQLP